MSEREYTINDVMIALNVGLMVGMFSMSDIATILVDNSHSKINSKIQQFKETNNQNSILQKLFIGEQSLERSLNYVKDKYAGKFNAEIDL